MAWIKAQQNYLEHVAIEAYPNVWYAEETTHGEFLIVPDHFPSTPAIARTEANADHIVEWCPARVLARITTERRMLAAIEELDCSADVDSGATAWEMLRIVGSAYAHRPGYREEWRP